MSRAIWDPAIDPVLCSPYHRPDRHWSLDDTGRAERGKPPVVGRRPPIRISVPEDQKSGQQQTLHLDDRKVNQAVEKVRDEVGRWREDGYPGVTATTRRLLHH